MHQAGEDVVEGAWGEIVAALQPATNWGTISAIAMSSWRASETKVTPSIAVRRGKLTSLPAACACQPDTSRGWGSPRMPLCNAG